MRDLLASLFLKAVKLFSGHGLGNIGVIGRTYRALLGYFHLKVIERTGYKIILGPAGNVLLSIPWGNWEELETEVIGKRIKKGDTVLDIGAHIGCYSLFFSKLVGKTGKVYAFEPDPANYELLEKNVAAHNPGNIVTERTALGNFTGKCKLFIANGPSNHLYASDADKNFTEVPMTTVDEYLKNRAGGVDFIKMDIEGAEYLAFQGMADLIAGKKPLTIAAEFCPQYLEQTGSDPKVFLEALAAGGFTVYDINDDAGRLVPVTDIPGFLAGFKLNTKHYFTNLLCVR
jgi:FkbM family methyltransferase